MYSGTFTPPSPGAWELETTHMTRPVSRWVAAVLPPAFPSTEPSGRRKVTRCGIIRISRAAKVTMCPP